MYGWDILCGVLKGDSEIPHKILQKNGIYALYSVEIRDIWLN